MSPEKIKNIVKKAIDKSPIGGTVLVERMESKTPKGWKVVGEISAVVASAGVLAAASITPAGWFTWGAWIGVGVFSLLGTWAGYQTDNDELKQLWKKPFSLFKKKR